ncbi:MAG: serine--tRNA ligase [Pirellulaceae bacterium]|nr:serine--tRNA ligase [Pirellulaceae bacterium]
MLDRKYILENAAAVKENCLNRGNDSDIDQLVHLENRRRVKMTESQDFNRQANEKSKLIGKAPAEEREALKEQARTLREQKDTAQKEHDALDQQILEIQNRIPNMSHPAAPIGIDDKANLELRKSDCQPREFDFPVLDHVDLGSQLDLFDFEGGARVAGSGFYFLKNDAVLLELALQQYALRLLIDDGFTPVTTPDLATTEILNGTGYIPRGPETQIYSIENSNLNLVATAEITIGGLLAGQTLTAETLPVRICGTSHCFRTEAGAHGKASRGLYRVHQFTKVEMFAFTLPEQSEQMLEHFCELECRLFEGLEIPFRVVDTATGDLGGPAYRKYDLEAWMPGRGTSGEYGEVTSTSNCTDFQARRLNVRYKTKGEKGTRFVHTLNGTAIAISRAMIALLENHQQADGSVNIPEALRPWIGKDRIEP